MGYNSSPYPYNNHLQPNTSSMDTRPTQPQLQGQSPYVQQYSVPVTSPMPQRDTTPLGMAYKQPSQQHAPLPRSNSGLPSGTPTPIPGNHPRSSKSSQIPASLQPLLSFPLNIHPNDVQDESYSNYTISTGNDTNWRLLFDQAENPRYIGESSGTSYLLQCRKLFFKVLGGQKFSNDPERFTFVDSPTLSLKPRQFDKLPERSYTDYLVTTYLNNLNNVLYVLDHDSLLSLVDRVYSSENVATDHPHDFCVLYLVLAIASVYSSAEISKKLFPFPENYFTDPMVYFETAMTILNTSAEDDNIWMAEAYLLIFFFYQFTGHKNTAWIKLGSAIRYALGLGLHRRFVNESYKDPKVILHRRKLFRSLYIMDTLSSVHLGRAMTIRLQEWDDIKSIDSIDDYQGKLMKVCRLNSKILEDVYYNPCVTLKIALNIAVDLKVFTLKNPIKPVSAENYPAPVDHKYLLPHVIYLHGIILLSRPFFHFVVLHKLGLVNYDASSRNFPHLENFYQSCIKSSLLIVKIVEYCYYQNIHPFKPMSLVSCTFHAGLVLGLLLLLKLKGIDVEMFKNDPQINVDPDAMLSHAMASVIKVLVHYGRIDPQSKRYADILQNMLDVTQHLPETVDGNESDSSSHTAKERINTQQNFENILRFQDWLFPKVDNMSAVPEEVLSRSGYDPSSGPNGGDGFLKDIAGLNNVDTSSTQFLDDFLYRVIDSNGDSRQAQNGANMDI